MSEYFAKISATKENQIHNIPQHIEDSQEIINLKEAISFYPKDYNLYIALGKAYNFQLRYKEAIECFTKAIEIDPVSPIAYRNRASRYINTLQFNKAYKDFAYCDSLKPNNLDNIYRMCIIKFYQHKYVEAVPLFEQALVLTKDDGEMGIGMLYWYILNLAKMGDKSEVKRVCSLYTKDMYVGHHTAYQMVVELFAGMQTPEEISLKMVEEKDDLEHATTMYGVYIYYSFIGESIKATQTLEKTVARDYVWPCFAYIAAYNDSFPQLAQTEGENYSENIPLKLQEFFKENKKIALAFSGGVDSSYLLYAAKAMNCDVTAFYVKTQFQPQFELEDGINLAKLIGAKLKIIDADALQNQNVRENPSNRCYFCKGVIFSKIIAEAKLEGYTTIIDGTNASDDYTDRPGMKALEELKVLSPLRLAGVTKADVRAYSKKAELFTWNKPSYACLATRIPTGVEITEPLLNKIEKAEIILTELGFKGFRVRILGSGCKLELTHKDIEKLLNKREEIYNSLIKEFDFVTVDIKLRGEE